MLVDGCWWSFLFCPEIPPISAKLIRRDWMTGFSGLSLFQIHLIEGCVGCRGVFVRKGLKIRQVISGGDSLHSLIVFAHHSLEGSKPPLKRSLLFQADFHDFHGLPIIETDIAKSFSSAASIIHRQIISATALCRIIHVLTGA